MGLALEVRDLSIRFGRKTVLGGVNFDVEAGSTLAIIGPNGSGKSVLFKALIGLLPHGGRVAWAADARLGYVPQDLGPERSLPVTCRDFLGAVARVSGARGRDPAASLEKVGMAPAVLDLFIGALSGGQFQRLLVACALIRDPNVLLLDEAAAGVDEPGQAMLHELLQAIRRRGCSILFISHELTVVGRYADKVLCLAHGEAWWGPPKSALDPGFLARMYGPDLQYHWHDHPAP